MSEMDWELSSPPYISQHNAGSGRCPYRPPTSQTANFPFSAPQPASVNANVSFPPPPAPPRGFWENISQQSPQSIQGGSNRFNPMSTGPPPLVAGRGPETNSLDFHMGLDGQPQSSSPARPSRFEPTRPLVQRSRSHQVGMSSAGEPQGSLPVAASQSSPPGPVDFPVNNNGAGPRRNASGSTIPNDNGSSNLPTSPNRHLPPPNSLYHGLFLPPHVPYARHARYSADISIPNGPQSSVSNGPPYPQQPPPWETSFTRAESGPTHPPLRNWFHEAFYTPQVPDMDSDDDSIDPQEDSSRRQGRPEPGSTFQMLHESMRVSSGARRIANPFDIEGHELALERSRAARRAAAAAVKFVASASALAALEKVDVNELTGDDKNCIICYNEFGVKNPDGFVECPVRLPKCQHVFGDRCLKQWLQDSDSCPYCRDKLPSEPKRSHSGDDVRRLIAAQARSYGADPWAATESSRIQVDALAGSDREQHYHQFMQHRLERRDGGGNEIIARIRRQDEFDWAAPFNQSSIGLPSRSIPDPDGRRRYRGRHNVSRVASQTAGRGNGPTSTRSVRSVNLQPNVIRTPVHNSTASFDENTTSQRRSVTPHPTIVGTPTWSSPAQIQPVTSGRPSSLPTARSPLGEAPDIRPDIINSRSHNGNNILPTNPANRAWSDNQNTPTTSYNGWMMPVISNGRPASATFINELPQARLQHFHENATGNPVPNNRLPPYPSNANENDFDPLTGSFVRR